MLKAIGRSFRNFKERMSMSEEEYYLSKSTDPVDCEHRQREIMYGKYRRDGFLKNRY